MFDVGWSEILLIGAVAVVVLGPEEIPEIMKTAARVARRLQYVRFALSQQFEDLLKEAGVDDLRKQVNFEEHFKDAEFDEKAADEEAIAIKPPEKSATEKKPAANDDDGHS